MNDPIISTNGGNRRADPEIADAICIYQRGGIKTFRRRALVGWIHQNDTARDRRDGKVWCWVSENDAYFQVYDEHFNRSEKAGQPRFCGVANFTMVRMFHPYWARNGVAPRDKRPSDKRWCREQYIRLMRRYEAARRREAGEDSSDSDDDDRRRRRRPPKRSTGRKASAAKKQKKKRADTSSERSTRFSSSENEVWAFPDTGSESESHSSEQPLISRKKRMQRLIESSDDDDDESDHPPSKRHKQQRDTSDDDSDYRSRRRQRPRADSSDGEDEDSMNRNHRTRDSGQISARSGADPPSQDTSLEQDPEISQEVAMGNTETYDGVDVEALPALDASTVSEVGAFMEGRGDSVTSDAQWSDRAQSGEHNGQSGRENANRDQSQEENDIVDDDSGNTGERRRSYSSESDSSSDDSDEE